jgi:ATP-dependent DNA helicase RecQ
LYGEKDLTELAELYRTRFPTMEQIRNVYHALVNFLQIPSYTGESRNFVFRFEEFIRNYKLKSQESFYALKALEQDGWFEFNEKNFTPATILFTTSREGLTEFENSFPQHEPLLTTILRTYEGIFDYPAFISEFLLAKLLKKHEEDIKMQLKTIAAFGIISYTSQNEDPVIQFKKHRVPSQELEFKLAPYHKRRDAFISRVQNMIGYTKTADCRSRYSSLYFGDEKAGDCGICDNCLRKKSATLSTEEFEKISKTIRKELTNNQLTTEQLFLQIRNIQKDKAWKVLRFLQAEHKIEFNHEGMMRVRGEW